MHFLVLCAVLFLCTRPPQAALQPVYLSVLSNGTTLASIEGPLLLATLPSKQREVITGPAMALYTKNQLGYAIDIQKLCTANLASATHHSKVSTHPRSGSSTSPRPDDINCEYKPPLRTTYYTEKTSPWLKNQNLNVSVFRLDYSSEEQTQYSVQCVSEDIIKACLQFVSLHLRLLTNNRTRIDLKTSFISPVCIPASYIPSDNSSADNIELHLHNKILEFLNKKNESLYNPDPYPDPNPDTPPDTQQPSEPDYTWLKSVPNSVSFRLFVSSTFTNYGNYKLTLNASTLFKYTAAYWNYGPWVYMPHVPLTLPVQSLPALGTTELMRSVGYLSELSAARIMTLETAMKADGVDMAPAQLHDAQLDSMDFMGSGDADFFSVPSMVSQIYQMGIVPDSKRVTINTRMLKDPTKKSSASFLLLANDCPYSRGKFVHNQSVALAIEIQLDNSFVSTLKDTESRSIILEYKRASNYSFGGLSIRLTGGNFRTPGARFDSLFYSINSEQGLDLQSFPLADSQPIPGRLWRCPFCDRHSFGILVGGTVAPHYTRTLEELLTSKESISISQLSYAFVTYFYYPGSKSEGGSRTGANSNSSTNTKSRDDNTGDATALQFFPFELTTPPGIVCTTNTDGATKHLKEINCSSYTYTSKSALFNLRPLFRTSGGRLRFYSQSNAYSWPHYTFNVEYPIFKAGTVEASSSLRHTSCTLKDDPTASKAHVSTISCPLQVKFNTAQNQHKPLPATLLVNYVCGWQPKSSSDASSLANVYPIQGSTMYNALLVLTDEGNNELMTTHPGGYVTIRDMLWNAYTWKYKTVKAKKLHRAAARLSKQSEAALDSDDQLKRDYEFVQRVRKLPYTDTQCTFTYYAHVYTVNGSLSNYSDVYTYSHYKAKTRRIAVSDMNYATGTFSFTAASIPTPPASATDKYECASVIFRPTIFNSKQWYPLLNTYDVDKDVTLFLDFGADIPEYLVIFITTIRGVATIDCRMLSVAQNMVRDEDESPVVISYKISLLSLIGEQSFRRHSANATSGVSISFSDDITLMNLRIVSRRTKSDAKPDPPTSPKKADYGQDDGKTYTLNTDNTKIVCKSRKDKEAFKTWTHDEFTVKIGDSRYKVRPDNSYTVNVNLTFYRGIYAVPYIYWNEYKEENATITCARGTYIWRGLNSSLGCVDCPNGSICIGGMRKSCGFGFFTSKNSRLCDNVYPGEYSTMSEELVYKEPAYHVQHTSDGSGYLTTNCIDYMYMHKAFCAPCMATGYVCISGKEQIPCPVGFRCLDGEAIPCTGDEYQDEIGQAICKTGRKLLQCDDENKKTIASYSPMELAYLRRMPLAVSPLVSEGPNSGCRPCPPGYECSSTTGANKGLSRCGMYEYSLEGQPKCKACPKNNTMQSDIGDTCIDIPLTVRNDANIDPEDQACNPSNCKTQCIQGVCVPARGIPEWALITLYFLVAVLLIILFAVVLIFGLKFGRRCKVRRRRCDGH